MNIEVEGRGLGSRVMVQPWLAEECVKVKCSG